MKPETDDRLCINLKTIFYFRWQKIVRVAVILIFTGGFALLIATEAIGPVDYSRLDESSVIVLDRNKRLLRPFLTSGGRWRLPVNEQDIDPAFTKFLIMAEDQRFEQHQGIDYQALGRASLQFLVNGRVISGASTLDMQVARLLEPRNRRTLSAKFRQIIRARQLNRKFSKQEILHFYYQLAPYGGNLEGIRAASLVYFGKEPARLSLDEIALLVALPQSPEKRRPDRFPAAAKAARDRIIRRAAEAALVTREEAEAAMKRPVPEKRKPFPMLAPHLSEQLAGNSPEKKIHHLTIDRDIQLSVEKLAQETAIRLGQNLTLAIIVLDNKSGAVLSLVGSSDYFDEMRLGGNDMTRAIRSPGSALKPFIYALGFDSGLIHPETLLEDKPVRFGTYMPKNFDGAYQGVVSAREALQFSLNVPAVDLLARIGPNRFVGALENSGIRIVFPDEKPPGLAVALGGMGITLRDLTRLYAGFARRGAIPDLKFYADQEASAPIPLFSDKASWYIWDILKDAPVPDHARQGITAFKTGTSYGYRDAVSVGFDRLYTVGVWVGRADGSPVQDILGRTTAAPVLFDVFSRLGGGSPRSLPKPDTIQDISSVQELPPPLRHIRQDIPKSSRLKAQQSVEITYPVEGAVIDLAHMGGRNMEELVLKAHGGTLPLRWFINGIMLHPVEMTREARWKPDHAGSVRITVMDGEGRINSVLARIE